MSRSRRLVLAALLTAFLTIGVGAAQGHVAKRSGSFEVELGWAEEPPRVGVDNSIEIAVSDAQTGAPVAVPAGALSVAVAYGGATATLPLIPTAEPGALEASITPTRPGAYGFSVSGEIHGQPLDVSAVCSQSTFECVEAGAGDEFPVKDPSAGELAQRLSSEAQQVEDARSQADDAHTLALISIAVGTLGLVMGGAALVAMRGRGSERS
ncbi:MAG TPA: hypothetical protein VJ989_01430 [Solirubrobacterales bacterium]|nr:hypothetical protein [Solirubrobacterales bacterium]